MNAHRGGSQWLRAWVVGFTFIVVVIAAGILLSEALK